ncbi:MAG: hypothetical protein UHM23_06930 [Clostridia bacterium]|jgi:flagellar basal body-associated protein FliL|nr:hypothetical protein [Clostridia bacterium]
MSDNKEFKEIQEIVDEDNIPMTPHVNEKAKYYLILLIVILSVASAVMVIFFSKNDSENRTEQPSVTETQIHK